MNRDEFLQGLSRLKERETEALYYWVEEFSKDKETARDNVAKWLDIEKPSSNNLIRFVANKFGYSTGEELFDDFPSDFSDRYKNLSDLLRERANLDYSEPEEEPPEPPPDEIEYEPPPDGEKVPVRPPGGVVILPPPPDETTRPPGETTGGLPPDPPVDPVPPPRDGIGRPLLIFIVAIVLTVCISWGAVWIMDRLRQPTVSSSTQATLDARATRLADMLTVEPTEKTTIEPTIRVVLFTDDFEEGLNPEWAIVSGDPIAVKNDFGMWRLRATSDNTWLSIGDDSWKNYEITFDLLAIGNGFERSLKIGTRANTTSYMVVLAIWFEDDPWSEWYIVENGVYHPVPETLKKMSLIDPEGFTLDHFRGAEITIIDDQYTLVGLGSEGKKETISSFIHPKYPQGEILIGLSSVSSIDNFQVVELP